MIATQNQPAAKQDALSSEEEQEIKIQMAVDNDDVAVNSVKPLETQAPLFLQSRTVTHTTKAGLNPIVDAAGYLLSVIGKLKAIKSYRQPAKLQKELMHELTTFQESIKHHGYNTEYVLVCHYVLCATIDDMITHTPWGSLGQWERYSLLTAFKQDTQHHDKFFTIMERIVKEPAHYIDLMELMYVCLSLGYKGQYRATEHSQYQLEQITHQLYKHIRAYRGHFSKALSPAPLKISKAALKRRQKSKVSLAFIFFITGCIIMTIFVGLSYLMDVLSNEAYKNISQFENPVSRPATNK